MSIVSNIKVNLETQIVELEALQSVYPEELSICDHGNLADINDYIAGKIQEVPQRLEYDIKVSTSKGTVELLVNLPLDYPNVYPEIYCRSSVLDRNEQMQLNRALQSFTQSQEKDEPIIYSLISWIQDNAETYLESSSQNGKNTRTLAHSGSIKKSIDFARYWIYSHHIYSKIKRKHIVDLAKDCNLTGFSFVGRPGIICFEGAFDDCEYCWQQIKAMNWQRILVKFLEKEFEPVDDLDTYRKFSDFHEMCFPTLDRHNDMGLLKKYLTEHCLDYAFKELFGIEDKSAQLDDKS
ncbi:RWD domain-containing protein 2A [Copidosoma floridanum]|uniref:RWD domain-containing protein 2A n=1 Tax=Copidosoma floridanum TaxID=29053 RepID=UPI0006C9567C|nr:RWD domain-containing protein 2A [Copidosoma floridanum]